MDYCLFRYLNLLYFVQNFLKDLGQILWIIYLVFLVHEDIVGIEDFMRLTLTRTYEAFDAEYCQNATRITKNIWQYAQNSAEIRRKPQEVTKEEKSNIYCNFHLFKNNPHHVHATRIIDVVVGDVWSSVKYYTDTWWVHSSTRTGFSLAVHVDCKTGNSNGDFQTWIYVGSFVWLKFFLIR